MKFWIATADFETRSRVDLKEVGTWRYSVDPSTEVLCFHYALDDGPVERWRPGLPKPKRLLEGLRNGSYMEAHASFFEVCIWLNIMVKRHGWPMLRLNRIVCSAARAAVACLPRELGKAGFHAGCEHVKMDNAAMEKLCRPRTARQIAKDGRVFEDDPALFEQLYEYCDGDVLAERDLSDRLPALSERERRVFLADQNINLRGLRIDVEFVQAAIVVNRMIDDEINSELLELTGGRVQRATQRDRILAFLRDDGLSLPNLQAETIEDYLYEADLTDLQRRILVLRQEGSRSSVSKFQAFEDWRDGDVVRGLYVYYGANAHGRFSGRGPQPQSMPRGDAKSADKDVKGSDKMEAMVADIKRTAKDGRVSRLRRKWRVEVSNIFGDPTSGRHLERAPPAEVLATAIRGVFIAREGKTFGVGDYSAIEARKVFWFANEERGLKIMADGGDIYRDQASDIFKKPPEALDVDFERMMGKTVILGCGYGMAWKKFKMTCKRAYGMIISDELAKKSVESYRSRYKAVPQLWSDLHDAAVKCIRRGVQVDVGLVTFWMDDGDLKIRLPSGRDIVHRNARLGREVYGKRSIVFTNGKGYPEDTYGGKLTEYISSGSARDVLADAIVMAEFDYDDVDPVMHSHDELVCEGEPGKVGKIVEKIMADAVAKYKGLPMKIETWESPRYRK